MKKILPGLLILISFTMFAQNDFDPEKDITLQNWFEKGAYRQGEQFKMLVSINVPEGYHITDGELFYFDTTGFPELEPDGKNIRGETIYKGEKVFKGEVSYLFTGNFSDTVNKKIISAYQICSELGNESCYMPVERELLIDFGSVDGSKFTTAESKKEPSVTVDEKSVGNVFKAFWGSDDDMTIEEKLAAILEGSHTWTLLVFLIAFLGGILDSMTPCVYPVIPVVISYMGAKSGNKKSAGFFLSLFFVVGLAITYSIVGLLASFLGGIFGVGDIAANPVVRVVIASIFTILALSMFGLWEMNVISSDQQTKWMKKGKENKGILGAVIIGMVSGVVAAPCVGPVLAVLLIHVATAGDVLYGWLLFIAFAFGLGLLFIVLGTFSGAINSLPRAGAWMMNIKKFFGVVMIGAALYFISILIPDQVMYFIIAVLTTLLALYMGVFDKLDRNDDGFFKYLSKAFAIFIFLAGMIFAVKTIAHYVELPLGSQIAASAKSEISVPFVKTDSDTGIIKNAVQNLDENKLVMVDFWAEWCMNCKALDKVTWNFPGVVEFSEKYFVPIKLDFTDKNSEFSVKYLTEYKEYGATNIPLILFINKKGEVVEKIQGLIEGEMMLKKMKTIIKKQSSGE
jgi:thioredoxin:protein disulfide reductase